MSGMQDVDRYRAERLARTHYTKLQAPVARFVRRRLGRAAENLPNQELEASYNLAWGALMRQVTQGRPPDCIDGWLRWLRGYTHAAAAQRVGVSKKCLEHTLYGNRWRAGLKEELALLLE